MPLSGSFSLEPDEITISAPSITIQTENLAISSPERGTTSPASPLREQPALTMDESPFSGADSIAETSGLASLGEAPAIESLNVDELEFVGPIASAEEMARAGEESSQLEVPTIELEVPTIEKEETLHLLAEEEPPLQAESQAEVSSMESPFMTETYPEKKPFVDENEEIISVSGEDLDRFLYGESVEGVEIISEEVGEEVAFSQRERPAEMQEILVEPEVVQSSSERTIIEKPYNQVPVEENFELIVEDKSSFYSEKVYTSEPTEVLRETTPGQEREKEVSLPDLQVLDEVIAEPLAQKEAQIPLELEEGSLEPISFEEPVFEKEESPVVLEEIGEGGVDLVESPPELVDVGESLFVSEMPPEYGAEGESVVSEDVDFQFDLSAIPDLQPTVEDENEPIALSLEELNNIEVTEEPTLQLAAATSIDKEVGHEIASTGQEEGFEESDNLNLPFEAEVPLSPESFDSIIAEEEKIEEIKQQDLTQLIEIAEPDIESEDVLEEKGTETLPLFEEAETVEVSLDEFGMGESPTEEPVVGEAYMGEVLTEDVDRRQMIESNLDALSGATKEELRKVIQYLDNLLADLPENKIKEFAQSEYYDLYMKIMQKLGL